MIFRYLLLTVVLLLISHQKPEAQITFDRDNEYGVWSELTLSVETFKDLHFIVSPSIRLNSFDVEKRLFEIGLKYKPYKFLYLGFSHRYSEEPKKKKVDVSHRFSYHIGFKVKLYNFIPEFKLRYTSKNELDKNKNQNIVRYKASLSYNRKKAVSSPYMFSELFQEYESKEYKKIRSGLGVSTEITKKISFDVSYLMEYSLKKEENAHVFAIGFKFKI